MGRIPKDYRINGRIRVQQVRLIDETGKQLGVMPTRTAMDTAQARGLDLVEVAPNAAPPVCRLLDYGKFRYEVTRKEREARKGQKSKGGAQQQREVRFKTRIGDHDRETKTRLVKRLLEEGSKVRVSVSFRAREITHPEFGMAVLRRVAEDLIEDAEMEKTPGFEGRFLTMVLVPTDKKTPEQKEPQSAKA